MTRTCCLLDSSALMLIFIIYSQPLPPFKGEHSKIYDRCTIRSQRSIKAAGVVLDHPSVEGSHSPRDPRHLEHSGMGLRPGVFLLGLLLLLGQGKCAFCSDS